MISTALLWMGYFAVHSLLASEPVKAWTARRAPALVPIYRLLYNMLALSGLLALVWLFFRQPVDWLLTPGKISRFSGALLLAVGMVILWLAFRHYSFREFAGLDVGKEENGTGEKLNTSGLNAWVRHPLYLGTLFMVAGGWLLYPTAAATGIGISVLAYLPFGIYWEEQKLVRQYGETYRNYQKQVKRLIPGIW